MMAYFATHYTIHFDDTMAYGSHHFLTSFKFQCASRETFLFGERVFDIEGVRESLDRVHLFTSDAYARNLDSAKLGDRIAILLTLEDWGRVSARFCYRVIGQNGNRISAGFQTLVCADAQSGSPIPMPAPLRYAMDSMREIEESHESSSFRDAVLAGGSQLDAVFDNEHVEIARQFLLDRYPKPTVIAGNSTPPSTTTSTAVPNVLLGSSPSAEAFSTLQSCPSRCSAGIRCRAGGGAEGSCTSLVFCRTRRF